MISLNPSNVPESSQAKGIDKGFMLLETMHVQTMSD